MTEERKGPGTLNRKLEYNRCLVPSLGVDNCDQLKLGKNLSVEDKSRIPDSDQRFEYEENERAESRKKPESRKKTHKQKNRERMATATRRGKWHRGEVQEQRKI